MKLAVLCVVVTYISLVKGATKGNNRRLRSLPLACPDFNVEAYLGRWYDLVFLQPCSYKGAEDHSNQVHDCTARKGYLACLDSYRGPEGDCVVDLPARLYLTDIPGKLKISDNIGRAMNGHLVCVAWNPKQWIIEWGCSGKYENGLCTDAWISAKTRKPNPDPYTIQEILKLIYKIFGVTASELAIRDQSHPCLKGRLYGKPLSGGY